MRQPATTQQGHRRQNDRTWFAPYVKYGSLATARKAVIDAEDVFTQKA